MQPEHITRVETIISLIKINYRIIEISKHNWHIKSLNALKTEIFSFDSISF